MDKKKPGTPQTSFKARMAELVLHSNRNVSDLAKELGVSVAMVEQWKKEFGIEVKPAKPSGAKPQRQSVVQPTKRTMIKPVSRAASNGSKLSKSSKAVKAVKAKKRKPLAKFNPKPRSAWEIKIAQASSGGFNSVPQIKITKIWSELFPGVVANYLPGGSGGNNDIYIMVGAAASNTAYIGVKIQASASDVSKVLVCLYRSDTNTLVGTPVTVDPVTMVANVSTNTYPLDPVPPANPSTNTNYYIFAWIDENGDQTFDPGDPCADTSQWGLIKLVSDSDYTNGIALLNAIIFGFKYVYNYPFAAQFLTTFVTPSTAIPGATPSDITIQANTPQSNDLELHHNTGVVWDSGGSGPIKLYTFAVGSDLAIAVRSDNDFNTVITNTLNNNKQLVQQTAQDPIQWPPSEPYHNFDFYSDPTMEFGSDTNADDLHYTFDNVKLFNSTSPGIHFTVKVQRSNLSLVELDISGFLTKLYSFNYDHTDRANGNMLGAVVQAGYCPSINKNAGHVFKAQVNLDYANFPFSFNFSS